MTELDIQAQKDYAVKEALAEGEAKKSFEIAKNLLGKGMDLSFICEVTGLSAEEVQRL